MDTASGWTLEELGARVAEALAGGVGGALSGRVREVPDGRTIRYYGTLGLVDRPLGSRGRVALYGRRHLLQLVAIKRLQGEGRSLREVQERLLGVTEAGLEGIGKGQGGEGSEGERPREGEGRGIGLTPEAGGPLAPFEPRAHARGHEEREGLSPGSEPRAGARGHGETRRRQAFWKAESAVAVQGVKVGEGVTVLVEGLTGLNEREVAELRRAAEGLVRVVERLRGRGDEATGPGTGANR